MQIIRYPDRKTWYEILKRPVYDPGSLKEVVIPVIDDVRQNGDAAVKKYTERFDQIKVNDLVVSEAEIRDACENTDESLKNAMRRAADNIGAFHKSQIQEYRVIETSPGVKCWQKSVAIEKVGLYIPGGSAPLFSTVLMLGIPAVIAGCKNIVLCTPPDKEGKVNPAILFAADLAGIKNVYKIGGAQAIAAMAYGTESVPKVYKIFGPGNQYVTIAKQLLSLEDVAIDMPAGPSEVAVMADKSCNPRFVAADLLSQAEHGEDSQVILVTTEADIVNATLMEIKEQLDRLQRSSIAVKALENSKTFILNNEDEMIDLINEYAPEHLIIAMKNYDAVKNRIINAGSVFLGNYTPESAGDYASGTNHTLPTNGYARSYSGVNLDSFVKKITFQEITKQGLRDIGHVIEKMAEAEALAAHGNAVRVRVG